MGRLRPSGSPPAPPPTSLGQGPSLATERCPRTLPSGPTVEGSGISCSGDIGLPADGSHTVCVISLSPCGREDDGAVQGRGVAFGSAREGCSGEQDASRFPLGTGLNARAAGSPAFRRENAGACAAAHAWTLGSAMMLKDLRAPRLRPRARPDIPGKRQSRKRPSRPIYDVVGLIGRRARPPAHPRRALDSSPLDRSPHRRPTAKERGGP
jgi:hypothetical protein